MARERTQIEYRFIIPQGTGSYLMESESRPNDVFHMVDLIEGCSCESSLASGNKNCKHLQRLRRLAAEGRLPHQPNPIPPWAAENLTVN